MKTSFQFLCLFCFALLFLNGCEHKPIKRPTAESVEAEVSELSLGEQAETETQQSPSSDQAEVETSALSSEEQAREEVVSKYREMQTTYAKMQKDYREVEVVTLQRKADAETVGRNPDEVIAIKKQADLTLAKIKESVDVYKAWMDEYKDTWKIED